MVPGRLQYVGELGYGFVRNSLGRDIIGAKDFLQFLPLLLTLFSLILLNNVFGILPFIQYPTMSRLGVPLVLTLIVYIVYHTVAIRRKHGVLPYLKSLVPPGLPGWLKPILFEHLKHLSLHVDAQPGDVVFIVGGEYLLLHGDNLFLNFSGILSFGFSIGMTFFELLIEFLQAFIFTLLAALYISDAVSEHH